MRWTAVGACVDENILRRLPSCGKDQCTLGFEVEVFLPAGLGTTLNDHIAGRPCVVDVTERKGPRWNDQRTGRCGFARIEDARQLFELDLDGGCRLAGAPWTVGDDDHDGLAGKVDLTLGEQRFVLNNAADLVFSGDVGGREDTGHTVDFSCRGGVEAHNATMGDRRGENRRVEQPRRIRGGLLRIAIRLACAAQSRGCSRARLLEKGGSEHQRER